MSLVTNLSFEPGYIIVHRDSGAPTKYGIADVLRALDIPAGLTYEQIDAIRVLANMVVILVRTLIDRGVLNDDFLENSEYDLATIVSAIEAIGGDYIEPDITEL